MGFTNRDVALIIGLSLLCCPFTPCICVYRRIHDKFRKPKPYIPRSYGVVTVPPPEIPRPRPLTPPLENEDDEEQEEDEAETPAEAATEAADDSDGAQAAIRQKTYTQSQSSFFQVLPPEIRQMIYFEVLVPQFALFPAQWGDSIRCQRWDHEHLAASYKDTPHDEWERIWEQRRMRPRQTIMGLLTSCRRIYGESINIFYAQNTFRFRDPRPLNLVPKWIISNRLQSIRHICITIDPDKPTRDPDWTRACKVVALMTGLRKFVVTFPPRPAHADMTSYLYPMARLTVSTIIVYAGENVCFHGGRRGRAWLDELPFRVIRTDEPQLG
ncbi:hypothetical protein BJY00DRAFT_314648 [Aspergillus carlsbadensis]|nr:hypothetical protein BJY00DRAFT_314648 [Aspergillus carlsbadensis]